MRKLAAFLGLILAFSLAPVLAQDALASPGTGQGQTSLGLSELLRRSGAQLRYDPLSQSGSLSLGERYLRFSLGLDLVYLGDGRVASCPGPWNKGGELYFSQDFARLAETFLNEKKAPGKPRVAAIFLDPGHGGKDPGAISPRKLNKRQIFEKDVNLAVSEMLVERLTKAFPDKVVMASRRSDVFLELPERTAMANAIPLEANELCFSVSVHTNLSLSSAARGYEVWYLPPEVRRQVLDPGQRVGSDSDILPILNDMLQEEYTTESIILARKVIAGLGQSLGDAMPSRGLRENDWYMVKHAKMPAILIEVAFLSNEKDYAILTSDEGLKKLAEGIYNGILGFVDYLEGGKGFIK